MSPSIGRAYSYALAGDQRWAVVWVCLPRAHPRCVLGRTMGFPGWLRLRGDYLASLTLAFGVDHPSRLTTGRVTGGPNGVIGNPASPLVRHSACPAIDGCGKTRIGGEGSRRIDRIFVLYHPGAGALTPLGDDQAAPAADRPRLGGAARDKSPAGRRPHTTTTNSPQFATARLFAALRPRSLATRQGFIAQIFTSRIGAVLAIVVLGGMGSQLAWRWRGSP